MDNDVVEQLPGVRQGRFRVKWQSKYWRLLSHNGQCKDSSLEPNRTYSLSLLFVVFTIMSFILLLVLCMQLLLSSASPSRSIPGASSYIAPAGFPTSVFSS